ncbi:DUF2797 domain-containing protein [Porticoccaceae bacterium LTM1]|nr:DUF2797 domain-containing protein [Porticoccaceae bacterium LTM1]
MTENNQAGHLGKMKVALDTQVRYQLPLNDQLVELNPLIGQHIRLEYSGTIHCTHCGRKTNKSFSQGYCYPCFTKLAQCDSCIVSPEKCHYHEGTCREPSWGEQFCMTDHIVYLANSSGVKVGITRASQIPTRWIDQGAVQALPILRVKTRQQSGLVEDVIRQYVADKTNWRAMLKNSVDAVDLIAKRDELLDLCKDELNELTDRFGINAIQPISDAEVVEINYPVIEYPTKVTSFNFDKAPVVEGKLMGIKGQYLILDTGVINIRKFTAYDVTITY